MLNGLAARLCRGVGLALTAVLVAGCTQASPYDGPAFVSQDLKLGAYHVTSAAVACRESTVGDVSTDAVSLQTPVQQGASELLLITLQPYARAGTYAVGSLGAGASARVGLFIRFAQIGEASPRTDYHGTSGIVTVDADGKSGVIDADAETLRLTGSWHCSPSRGGR
jgi:hypothetical protein